MNYKFLNAMLIAAIIFSSLGCAAPPATTPTPTQTATATPASSPTPTATETPAPTATPNQTATPTPAINRTPSERSVLIKSYAFFPVEVTIYAGDRVTWTNMQKNIVTLTAEDGSWNSTPMDANQTFTKVFPGAGLFNYTMKGASAVKGRVVVLP